MTNQTEQNSFDMEKQLLDSISGISKDTISTAKTSTKTSAGTGAFLKFFSSKNRKIIAGAIAGVFVIGIVALMTFGGTGNEFKGQSFGNECTTNSNCDSNQLCEQKSGDTQKKCWGTSGYVCENDSECIGHAKCESKKEGDQKKCWGTEGFMCFGQNYYCASGYECDTGTKKCVESETGSAPTNQCDSCSTYEVCQDNKCLKAVNSSCVQDSDCEKGAICMTELGAPICKGNIGYSCGTSTATGPLKCATGYCESGFCAEKPVPSEPVPVPPPLQNECDSDDDCFTGYLCSSATPRKCEINPESKINPKLSPLTVMGDTVDLVTNMDKSGFTGNERCEFNNLGSCKGIIESSDGVTWTESKEITCNAKSSAAIFSQPNYRAKCTYSSIEVKKDGDNLDPKNYSYKSGNDACKTVNNMVCIKTQYFANGEWVEIPCDSDTYEDFTDEETEAVCMSLNCASIKSNLSKLYSDLLTAQKGGDLEAAKTVFGEAWKAVTENEKKLCSIIDEKYDKYESLKEIVDTTKQCAALKKEINDLKLKIDDYYGGKSKDGITGFIDNLYLMKAKMDAGVALGNCEISKPDDNYMPYTCEKYIGAVTDFQIYLNDPENVKFKDMEYLTEDYFKLLTDAETVALQMKQYLDMYENDKKAQCEDFDLDGYKTYMCKYEESELTTIATEMDNILNGTSKSKKPKEDYEDLQEELIDILDESDCEFKTDFTKYKDSEYVAYTPKTCEDHKKTLEAVKKELESADSQTKFDATKAKISKALTEAKTLKDCKISEYDGLIARKWKDPAECAASYGNKFSFLKLNISSASSSSSRNMYIAELIKAIAAAESEGCTVAADIKALTTVTPHASAINCSTFQTDFAVISQYIQNAGSAAEMEAYKAALQQKMDDAKEAGCQVPIALLGVLVAEFVGPVMVEQTWGLGAGTSTGQTGVSGEQVSGQQAQATQPGQPDPNSKTEQPSGAFGAWPGITFKGKAQEQAVSDQQAVAGQANQQIAAGQVTGQAAGQTNIMPTGTALIQPIGIGQSMPQAQPGVYTYAVIPSRTGPETVIYLMIFVGLISVGFWMRERGVRR